MEDCPPKSACPVGKLGKHLWSKQNMRIIARVVVFVASVAGRELLRWLIQTLRQ